MDDSRSAMLIVLQRRIKQVLDKLTGLADGYWFVLTRGFLVESDIEQLAVEPPRIAIRQKARVEVHAKPMRARQLVLTRPKQSEIQFVCLHMRPLRINSRASIHQVVRDFYTIDDDEILAKYVDIYQVAWKNDNEAMASPEKRNKPYVFPHSSYDNQGWVELISKILPTKGRPVGPGGKGRPPLSR